MDPIITKQYQREEDEKTMWLASLSGGEIAVILVCENI
jgi:hypothetical protein